MDPVTAAAVARIVALAADADNPFGREPETGLSEGEAIDAWCVEATALVAGLTEAVTHIGLIYTHFTWQEVQAEIAKLAERTSQLVEQSEEHESVRASGYTQRELPGLGILEFPAEQDDLPAVYDSDGRQLADWEVQLLLSEPDLMGE
jgi:hypothetical protein